MEQVTHERVKLLHRPTPEQMSEVEGMFSDYVKYALKNACSWILFNALDPDCVYEDGEEVLSEKRVSSLTREQMEHLLEVILSRADNFREIYASMEPHDAEAIRRLAIDDWVTLKELQEMGSTGLLVKNERNISPYTPFIALGLGSLFTISGQHGEYSVRLQVKGKLQSLLLSYILPQTPALDDVLCDDLPDGLYPVSIEKRSFSPEIPSSAS